MKHLVPLSAALGLCLLAAPAVFADGTPPADTSSQAKAVEGDLDAAVKAKDDDGAAKAAGKLAKFYKDVQDPAVKASIAKDLSGLVKQTKLTAARRAGLDALVDTDDGATAWKSGLSGAYPNNDADDPTKFNVEIVKAVSLQIKAWFPDWKWLLSVIDVQKNPTLLLVMAYTIRRLPYVVRSTVAGGIPGGCSTTVKARPRSG